MFNRLIPSRLITRSVAGLLLAALMTIALPSSPRAATSQPAVAILYFDYTGSDAQLGVLRKGLAQMLISHIQPRVSKVQIVERERIEDLFKELELAASGKVDPATAAKVGKLIGARYLVVGSFFDLFGSLRVDSRMIEVETGKILTSVGKDGAMSDFFALEGALVDDLVTAIEGLDLSVKEDAPPTKVPARTSAPKKASKPKPKPRPQPKQVQTATVVEYSKALDAMDRGDVKTATILAKKVAAAEPEFDLLDLNSLVQ